MLLIVAMAGILLQLNQATGLTKQNYIQVEITDGDTLWDIATTHMPDNMDPRKAVHIISQLNNTSASELRPGQILKIPTEV
jgi:Tfp pilus assembly protein FimV